MADELGLVLSECGYRPGHFQWRGNAGDIHDLWAENRTKSVLSSALKDLVVGESRELKSKYKPIKTGIDAVLLKSVKYVNLI